MTTGSPRAWQQGNGGGAELGRGGDLPTASLSSYSPAPVPVEPTPRLSEHPLYRRMLGHLQQGEWPEALTLLHQLRAHYPGDPEIRATIAEVELRAALDKSQPTTRRLSRQTVLRLLGLALAALAFVGVIGVAVNLYQHQIEPTLARNRLAAEVAKLVQAGQQAYLAGDMDLATQNFQAALAQDPANVNAQQGLDEIEITRTLAQRYAEAVALMDAGRLEEAWQIFASIAQTRPSYRDVASRLDTIDRTMAAQEMFGQAEDAYADGDWMTAISIYEDLQTLDVNFERDQVRLHLFDSYFNQALALIAQAQDDPETLKRAADYLDKALRVQPQEPKATAERRLVRAYLAGSQAAAKGDWERALPQLEIVFRERPRYAGRPIGPWLVEGYLAQAMDALQAGDADGANQKFQQALDVARQVGPASERLVLQERLKAADAAYQAKDYAGALEGYQQVLDVLAHSPVELDVSPADIQLKAADATTATHDLAAAAGYLREALVALLDQTEGGPELAQQHLEQADKAAQTGDYVTALGEYRQAIEAVRGGEP
jgi:tetratricopeptide (TPR) repeat protein